MNSADRERLALVGIGEYSWYLLSRQRICIAHTYHGNRERRRSGSRAALAVLCSHSLDFDVNINRHQMSRNGTAGVEYGLRTEAANLLSQWKPTAANGNATPQPSSLPSVKPSSPPVTCPVRNVPLYLSQRPRRARYTPYTTDSFPFPSQASNTSPPPLGLPSLPLAAGWAPSTRTQR